MSNPCRIAVDARPLSIPQTGIGRYTYELLARLTRLDDHQWYLYSDRPLLRQLPVADNIKVRVGHSSHRLTGALYPQVVFSRWARQDRVCTYWTPRHHLPLHLPQTVRQVVTLHDLVYRKAPETMKSMGRLLESLLTPQSLRRADAIIAVSSSTVADLREGFGRVADKAYVVHEAATPNEQSAYLPSPLEQPYFIFAGTLEPRKNLQRLLQGFAGVRENLGETRLVLAGDFGWGDQRVDQWIEELGLQGRVEMTGRLDETTLHRYYRHALALLMPSLYEGFGLPLLEAMQYGVPVISSNRSSMPEVTGPGGILVDPQSSDEIGAAMVSLATDQDRRQSLCAAAQIQASKFSWDRAARETMAILCP